MTDVATHAFLGEEFLTWLWYRIETDGGDFELDGGHAIGVSFDDYLALAPRDDDETVQTLRSGTPTRSLEAAAGLRNGRRLSSAKLIVALGELQWQLVLHGESMGLRAIKLPEDDPEAESAEERSRERAANFALIHDLVNGLYREFLRVRLRADYLSEDGERQANWMQTR